MVDKSLTDKTNIRITDEKGATIPFEDHVPAQAVLFLNVTESSL